MALLDDVKAVCSALAGSGWRDLLLEFGLDITAADLKAELQRSLPALTGARPAVAGFEDFSLQGRRGIEPGVPDRSLLFHALASPGVVRKKDGTPLTKFPTPRQIETVENYIYSLNRISGTAASLRSLVQKRTGAAAPANSQFAIVVFAQEYRNAAQTVHRMEAGMCFSRTGVSRVGTQDVQYSAKDRGYLPHLPGQPQAFCALPARYAAYIAWRARGTGPLFGPMRRRPEDSSTNFWVPLHKLFDGTECLTGRDLKVTLQAGHVNEKLRRIHLQPGFGVVNAANPDFNEKPFVIRDGDIAAFATDAPSGRGLLKPVPHPLVEKAVYRGNTLAYEVPVNSPLSSSVRIVPEEPAGGVQGFRHAPEYVHARHKLNADGSVTDLNDPAVAPDVAAIVAQGGYRAIHYIDYTGDGWVTAQINVNLNLPGRAAYSLVTVPDFFFSASQRDMMDWIEDTSGQLAPAIPAALRPNIFRIPPNTLCDERLAANVGLAAFGAPFDAADSTLPAVVALPLAGRTPTMAPEFEAERHAALPDAASSVYEPGWDVSVDRIANVEHMAAHGLGSPFPEDGKLCAALSTFWPAVAPDVARVFEPTNSWPTISPMTDEEVGITGNLSVDGYRGPKLLPGGTLVEYQAFDYADYVDSALKGKFTLALTSKVTTFEYRTRVLNMARVYRALNARTVPAKAAWAVLSYREMAPADAELLAAQQEANAPLTGSVDRFEVYRHGTQQRTGDKVRVSVQTGTLTTFLVDSLRMLRRQDAGPWQVVNI